MQATPNSSLRTLSIVQRDEYSKRLMSHVSKLSNSEMQISVSSECATCLLSGVKSSTILDNFNNSIISQLNLYIEDVLKTDPSYYNRNLILFETQASDDHIVVKWQV